MEKIVSLIFHGCKLAKDLEDNLPTMANQPHLLINTCDEIISVFGNTKQRLEVAAVAYGHHDPSLQLEVGGGAVHEWPGISQAMEMVVNTPPAGQRQHGLDGVVTGRELGGGDMEAVVGEGADSGRALSRQRRGKEEPYRQTITVPAPMMGNTEIPPEDGYTWRKYCQKEILGSRFPRGYYRCTYQKLYNCRAKKQVQRLDYDPYTFEVTYRGYHTCTMSTTTLTMMPPPPSEALTTQSPSSQQLLTTSLQWSTPSRGGPGVGSYSISHSGIHGSYGAGTGGSRASPSYIDYPRATYLTDPIFTSGSNTQNSMDLIFPSEKSEQGNGEKTE